MFFYSESASPETISTVTKTLQWILLTESLILDSTASVNITSKFCRLYTIFLAGNLLYYFNPKSIYLCF